MECVLEPHTYITEEDQTRERNIYLNIYLILFKNFVLNVSHKWKKNGVKLPGVVGLWKFHYKPPGEPGTELQLKFSSEPCVPTAFT